MDDVLLGSKYEIVDGHFVSTEARRVVEAIKEFEPQIDVQWIPPGAREEGQAAWRLVHNMPGRLPYIIFTVRRDEDMNISVLQKLMANDQRSGTTPLSEFDALDAAKKALENQAYRDSIEEANDIAYHVMRSRLNKYKVNNDVIIRDYGGML